MPRSLIVLAFGTVIIWLVDLSSVCGSFLFLVFTSYVMCAGKGWVRRDLVLRSSAVRTEKLVVCSVDSAVLILLRCMTGIRLVLFLVMW